MCVFGTRPEAVKMSPLICELKKYPKMFKVIVVVTAQHRQMLDQVLTLFNIKPHYDLNIMKKSQNLYQVSTNTLNKLGKVIKKERPDLVCIHGDTTTTLFAAITSFYEKIPVAHIEAGLRSYDKFNPYPEEVNRLLSDALCVLHFAPTKKNKKNLLRENISPEGIFITGNTGIDALKVIARRKRKIDKNKLFHKKEEKIILVTAHRRENWGKPLMDICYALREIAQKHKKVRIIYPVHLNPEVTNTARKILSGIPNVSLISPLNYVDFVNLMKLSYLVLTDSGGIQEEAPSLGKPVLVLRKVTERPEAVKFGTVKIIGTNKKKIVNSVERLLTDKKEYQRMAKAINPYGDGKASKRIRKAILYYFKKIKFGPKEFVC